MLIEANLALLDEAADLIRALNDETYQRAGAQFRHILEFYESLLDGFIGGFVDYDARKRDVAVERSRSVALGRIDVFKARLRSCPADRAITVRAEDADFSMTSSISRELQAVRSHTIHHFAVIALMVKAWGVAVPVDFGVAPSTLRHRKVA